MYVCIHIYPCMYIYMNYVYSEAELAGCARATTGYSTDVVADGRLVLSCTLNPAPDGSICIYTYIQILIPQLQTCELEPLNPKPEPLKP